MPELKDAPKPKVDNGHEMTKQAASRPAAAPAPAPPRPGAAGPFTFVRRFAEEMDRLFEDFGLEAGWRMPPALTRGHELLRREAGLVSADWSPHIDILERKGHLVVRADLPGMSKDDVKVDVADDMLTIRGERKHEKEEDRKGYHYRECSHGNFYRAIPLPQGVDASKATAEFRNGVLEVSMPAPPDPAKRARRVEIHESK